MKNLHEPTPEGRASKGDRRVSDVRKRPEAFRWITPVDTGGTIPLDEPDYTPELINAFDQPSLATGLEKFAFRLDANGQIAAKGFLDVSGATNGGIAFVMPGAVTGEADFIPPTARDDGFDLRVTTTGGVAGVTPASAHIDAATGNVTIYWTEAGASSGPAWAMIEGYYESDGQPEFFFDYYDLYIGDDSSPYFGYYVDAGAGQFGDDRAFLTMKQSGLYTFTQRIWTNDLSNVGALVWHSRLRVVGGAPAGPSVGPGIYAFPGQINTDAFLQCREQHWIDTLQATDELLLRSWTIPVKHPSPGSERRTGELRFFLDTPQTTAGYWEASIWIVRHGDLDWAATDFNVQTQTTWP